MKKLLSDIVYIFKLGYATVVKNKQNKKMLYISWGLILLQYFTSMIQPTLKAYMLDGIVSLTDDISYTAFYIALIGLTLSAISKYITTAYKGIIQERLSSNSYYEMQKTYLDKITKIKYDYFNSNKFYDLINFVTAEVPSQATMFVVNGNIITIIGASIALIFVMVTIIRVNIFVGILVFIGNLFAIFRQYYTAKLDYYNMIEQIPEKRWSDTYNRVITGREYMKENRLLMLTGYMLDKWKNVTKKLVGKNNKVLIKVSIIDLINSILVNIFNISALVFTAYLIINGETSVGSFMLVYSSFSVVTNNYNSVYETAKRLKVIKTIAEKQYEFEKLEEVEDDTIYEGDEPNELNVSFKNVKFSYGGTDFNAIDGIDVDIRQGERIAVVGENGSGKTTFVHLLNGLYQPTAGEILLNNNKLSLEIPKLKRYSTTLFQDSPYYEFSIKENIQVGNVYDDVSGEDVIDASKSAGFDDFVNTLNDKYETNIGTLDDAGVFLSGGQLQKMALSRVLMRKNSKLLIMDEPTAALDPVAENRLYEEVVSVAGNRTTIMVSHRLGITSLVDRILVFDKGKVIENGSHDELMKQKGVYYDMYNSQAHWYA